ncbi:MBL fold metallo-hydrolase [Amycolatopsis sp. CA-230715]|uniref:MBL fold metallo-hydrolase n=1 Tax=Amycolatopsis sp. CA-230715 TaxID=2745196 RepID=UPI001C032AE8|nr:MBL fold metallo-hydrolase [Amycolatopsis sp. CA-230715]QWF83472.1 hypothetical protein HUW46_06913 [Amycolatopsis sp. CA-230715]
MTDRWLELGEGVYARRYAELDLTVGLVVGREKCLVVDTRGDTVQGAELAAAVREITPLPWTIAITHSHFDHSFGTAAFGPCEVWAHPGCREDLITDGENARAKRSQWYRDRGEPAIADAIAATELVLPEHLVDDEQELPLGGRAVVLAYHGPAHSGHDLTVRVPDAGVLFAGDLVEHGPEGTFTTDSFGTDTVLDGWPPALAAIAALDFPVVVPGHGEPVDTAFVVRQHRLLADLVALVESGASDDEIVAGSALPPEVTRAALARRPAR